MLISAALTTPPLSTVSRLSAGPAVAADEPVDRFTGSEFWRDYGIDPKAMWRRAMNPPLAAGEPLPQGEKTSTLVMDELRQGLTQAIDEARDLVSLQTGLAAVAARFGVETVFESGNPLVNWDKEKVGRLDVRHRGGGSALHELVHLVQCVLGGGAALGRAAVERFQSCQGRPPGSFEELSPYLHRLSEKEKSQAMTSVVTPMERLAYSRFEEAAFHATGVFGRKANDFPAYQRKLKEVMEAFAVGYQEARVPSLATASDAKIYGGIGHLARTHGETALLLAGGGAAYYGLTKLAMRVHPALGIPMACPLGYLLYRAMVTG